MLIDKFDISLIAIPKKGNGVRDKTSSRDASASKKNHFDLFSRIFVLSSHDELTQKYLISHFSKGKNSSRAFLVFSYFEGIKVSWPPFSFECVFKPAFDSEVYSRYVYIRSHDKSFRKLIFLEKMYIGAQEVHTPWFIGTIDFDLIDLFWLNTYLVWYHPSLKDFQSLVVPFFSTSQLVCLS